MWSLDFKHLKEDHGNGQLPVELGNSSQPQCGLNQGQASREVDKAVDGSLHTHSVVSACMCVPEPVRVTLVRSHCHHLQSHPTRSLGVLLPLLITSLFSLVLSSLLVKMYRSLSHYLRIFDVSQFIKSVVLSPGCTLIFLGSFIITRISGSLQTNYIRISGDAPTAGTLINNRVDGTSFRWLFPLKPYVDLTAA